MYVSLLARKRFFAVQYRIVRVRTSRNKILRGPRSSSFWLPRNLAYHMDRQARTSNTVSAKSREMTGRSLNPALVAGRRRGKDDRKQNTLAPLFT